MKTFIVVIIVSVVALVAGIVYFGGEKQASAEVEQFAQCINDSGAAFYGTFWCPYCQDQKKMFGTAEELLPYVECSTPDRSESTEICRQEEIASYPTWKFSDGSVQTGVLPFNELSEKTDCPLPEPAN